ncbi:hypothetical protein GCM10023176_56890 [Micromonospora coerulea]|uniref:Uncharacterized protein n=1 Tax=Micromonospora coerulea TaxID=47856 RepID=A0ABP8T2S0_9ACTN
MNGPPGLLLLLLLRALPLLRYHGREGIPEVAARLAQRLGRLGGCLSLARLSLPLLAGALLRLARTLLTLPLLLRLTLALLTLALLTLALLTLALLTLALLILPLLPRALLRLARTLLTLPLLLRLTLALLTLPRLTLPASHLTARLAGLGQRALTPPLRARGDGADLATQAVDDLGQFLGLPGHLLGRVAHVARHRGGRLANRLQDFGVAVDCGQGAVQNLGQPFQADLEQNLGPHVLDVQFDRIEPDADTGVE